MMFKTQKEQWALFERGYMRAEAICKRQHALDRAVRAYPQLIQECRCLAACDWPMAVKFGGALDNKKWFGNAETFLVLIRREFHRILAGQNDPQAE